jgi:hypothetical protein
VQLQLRPFAFCALCKERKLILPVFARKAPFWISGRYSAPPFAKKTCKLLQKPL